AIDERYNKVKNVLSCMLDDKLAMNVFVIRSDHIFVSLSTTTSCAPISCLKAPLVEPSFFVQTSWVRKAVSANFTLMPEKSSLTIRSLHFKSIFLPVVARLRKQSASPPSFIGFT